ncbi:MAG: ABC transporter ATP-binding protein [Bowdeniella nasicola]|nr:ABC transporter ATP-binding protein [Bowdeniella nasicola]
MKVLHQLLRPYIREASALVVGVIIFQLAQSFASLLLPTLNADIIDQGVVVGDIPYIWKMGGVMLAVTLIQVSCAITAAYFGARLAMGIGRDLRAALFHHVVDFSQQEVSEFGAASLITRNTNDVQQVQMLVQASSTLMVSAPMLAIGGVVMALRQDAQLSWLLLVTIPVMLVCVSAIVIKMVPAYKVMQRRIDRLNQIMREQLAGLRVIRAFVREENEYARFYRASSEVADVGVRAGNIMAFMFPAIMLVMNVSSVAVIWFGGRLIDTGATQIGTLFAFLQYLLQILIGVMLASFMFVMIPRAAVCAARIRDVLKTEPTVSAPTRAITQLSDRGEVCFHQVEFAYPGAAHPVLHDISFTITPGKTTAIIGATGAGKTTLVGLVARLFDATGGQITFAGRDIRQLDPDTLWDHIGLVPQRAFLFSGTIATNLRYGNLDASDAELWQALEVAQAADFVAALPGQLDAGINQGGTNVSGGQRQRLAIARALVKNPSLYIFDDAFSALDMATDAALQAALRAHHPNASRLIVAQRISSIRDAEQIVVLDGGTIVGCGSHDQLVAQCATYREILASQQHAQVGA